MRSPLLPAPIVSNYVVLQNSSWELLHLLELMQALTPITIRLHNKTAIVREAFAHGAAGKTLCELELGLSPKPSLVLYVPKLVSGLLR
jgi:hypothetical protein